MIIDENVYTIQEDENSKLWDLRTTGELTIPFRIGQLTNDCSLVNRYKYIYGLTVDTVDFGESSDIWNHFSEIKKEAKKSFLLVDNNSEPLFCLDVLQKYGIGFILSDWIKVIDGKYKVVFDPEYVRNWIGTLDTEIITSDNIYSFNLLKKGIEIDFEEGISRTYSIPELNQYYKDGNEIIYSSINSEKWIKENFWGYRNATSFENRFSTDIITNNDYIKIVFGRQYLGAKMYGYIPGEENPLIEVKTSINENNVEFITFAPMKDMGANELLFYRCKTSKTVLNQIPNFLNKITLPACLWQDDTLYCIYGNSVEPNKYNSILHNTSYVDNDCIEQVTDSNGETPIKKELKYTKFSVNIEDIAPYNKIDDKFSFKKFFKYTYNTNVILERKTTIIGTEPSAEELLNKTLEENKLKYKTPNEYYSNYITSNSNENIEDAFDDLIENDRNWFWLNTIKNWCIYVLYDSRLELMCWNGIDGWDRVFDIMAAKNSANLYSLSNKYLYSQYFFEEGVAFPNDRWGCYTPVRYPTNEIGQVYYRSLILKQDTITKNYNNKFQNLHDTKIYQTGERNTYSNAGYVKNGTVTNGGKTIHVDIETKAVFGVQTQYCPTVLKNANGLMSIMYCFYLPTNGYGAPDPEFTWNIISPRDANERCRDIFGAGDDKTIDKDWKHYFNINETEEQQTNIRGNNDETIFGAASLTLNVIDDKINNIKITANRPNPTTNNNNIEDYLERWDK